MPKVVSAFKILLDPKRLRRQFRIAWDYAKLRISHSYLRGTGTGKRVLILSLWDWVPRAKMEGMLGKAMQLYGGQPIILTNHDSRWANKYFHAFGIHEFIYYDDLYKEVSHSEDEVLVDNLLKTHNSFQSLLGLTVEGIETGKIVLSTAVRHLMHGSVSFDDPIVQNTIRKGLLDSIRSARVAELIFDRYNIDAVLTREKGYTPFGEIFGCAIKRGIDALQHHHGQRQDAFLLKRYHKGNKDMHPFSLSQKSWQQVQSLSWPKPEEDAFMAELHDSYEKGTWFNRKFLLEGKHLKTPDEIRAQLHLDPKKKTAVVFSHVLWDATFFYGTSLFQDYEHWLIATVKAACENDQVNWVIKLHPDYTWKMKQMGSNAQPRDVLALDERIGVLPPHIQVVAPDIDISTYSFFAITDYCITVRGTIGIEAPCFGIQTFTAGTGRYSHLGFTNDSETAEEYLEKMKHIQDIPALTAEQTSLARRHAHALFNLRLLPFTTFDIAPPSLKDVGTGLDHNVVIHTRSKEELQNASDMKKFADWVLRSKDDDYLNL